MTDVIYGIQGKTYYATNGVAAPNWAELSAIKNQSLKIDGKEVDLTSRANGGWEAAGRSIKTASIEFDMDVDADDVGYCAIEAAFIAGTPMGMAIMSKGIAVSKSRGLWADMIVTNFSREESAEGAQNVKVTMKPTKSATPPSWHVIA